MTALSTMAQNTTLATVLADPAILKLVTASKGGFSGEDSFIEIGGQKVARKCAMLGAIFLHDNTDKAQSFFYKNGSYMIGAEVLKANARKAWELDREERELELENQMLDGTIDPRAWKDQVTAIKAEVFDYHITDEEKTDLIEQFNGYADEDSFKVAYEEEAIAPFSDYADEIKALRDLAPKRAEAEAEPEAPAEEA